MKTSAEIAKAFMNGMHDRNLSVKQATWLRNVLEREGIRLTCIGFSATGETILNDGDNLLKLQVYPNGAGRLIFKQKLQKVTE